MNSSAELLRHGIDFYKLNLGKKDFLLTDHMDRQKAVQEDFYHQLAGRLCPRRTGVGASSLLILASGSDGVPFLKQFTPAERVTLPGFDAMMVAAKYLFDTARFGAGLIRLGTEAGYWDLQPLDSQNFRLHLGKAEMIRSPAAVHNDPGVYMQLREPARFLLGVQTERTSMEDEKQPAPQVQGSHPPTVKVKLISQEEIALKLPRKKGMTDLLALSGMGALAACMEGLAGQHILVNCWKNRLVTEVNPVTGEIYITTSVKYVFSGNYSWTDLY